MTFHPDSLPDLAGRVYIVTGGNSGIGYYTVARLAQHGAHVYLCARNLSKGTTAIESIKKLYPTANISLLEVDHLSLSSVVAAAKQFLSLESSLHGLINNAGIMCTPYVLSKDGYEEQWQTNYLAHWVFTSQLLPLMLQTSKNHPAGTVRIVNVSSSGHYSAPRGGINFDDTSLKNESNLTRYGQSKLANVLHTKTLHRLYGPGSTCAKAGEGEIYTASIHPGLVKTQLGATAEISPLIRLAIGFASLFLMTDGDTGSWTSVFCAVSPDMKGEQSGGYFQRIAKESSWQSAMAKDVKLGEKLEEWTRKEMERGGWSS